MSTNFFISQATKEVLSWEFAFLKDVEQSKEILKSRNVDNKTLNLWYEAERSFGDISSLTMFQDVDKLSIGIILMFFYVQMVLSNFNWVEWRVSVRF